MSNHVSVKAIISKDNKVLFLKEKNGNWELPGGRPNSNENKTESLARELSEELGKNKYYIGSIFGKCEYEVLFQGIASHVILTIYEVEADNHNFKVSSEHLDYQWLGLDTISNFKMNKEYRNIVISYLKGKI